MKPSLSITAGKDGRVLLKCHGPGCTAQQIVAQIGMTMADLFPAPSPKRSKARIVKTYEYRDETGALLFEAVRFEPKKFPQRVTHTGTPHVCQ